jgi:translation initiation factor IF-2
MRARGSNITDIVVLVVAADDSVNEQTIEAISHAKASDCPIIVAVNKIDLPAANPQKVESDLMKHEIISEKMGGQNVLVNVSAKTKEGLDDLLDAILLQSEILELKANPDRSAEGIVIESKIEKGKGTVVSILIQNGSLRVGDIAVIGKEWGKVRAMYNDAGERVNLALPSYPIELLGLSSTPDSGEKLVVVENESRAREVTQYRSRMKRLEDNSSVKRVTIDQMIESATKDEKKEVSIIVKADVHGSKEAIEQSLNKMNSEKISIKIIHTGVGEINESDVTLAVASKAKIFGFNVKPNSQAKTLSKREGIDINNFSIIYEVLDEAQKIIDGLDQEKIVETLVGKALVKQIFELSDSNKVAGCVIEDGKVTSKCVVKILRNEEMVHECDIQSLRREKNQVKEVLVGLECGIVLSKFNDLVQNDKLEFYLREKDEKKP